MAKVLYETKFLSLKSTSITGHDWFYVKRNNSKGVCVILCVLDKKYIIFLKTKRPPLIEENVAEFGIELPAGLIGDINENEDINEAMKRELLEETGYKSNNFKILIDKMTSSSGLTDENSIVAYTEVTKDDYKKAPVTDNGIIVEVLKIPIDEIPNYIKKWQKEGVSISSQTLSSLYLYKIFI